MIRALAILLVSCVAAFGQAFSFNDLAWMSQGGIVNSSFDALDNYNVGPLQSLNSSDTANLGANFTAGYVVSPTFPYRLWDLLTNSTYSGALTALNGGADDNAETVVYWNGTFVAEIFTLQPVATATLAGNNVTLTATAPLATAYQWKKNGSSVVGATLSSFTLSSVSSSDWADYKVTATCPSAGGNFDSDTVNVAIVDTTTVSNWVTLCGINGGTLTSNTIYAVNVFWNGMITDGIDTDMYSVNCYVPDHLQSCLTPLVNIGGPTIWVNNGPFVSGDLTVNGLISSGGGTKYLDTGIKDSTTFSSVNDVGFTIYFSATPSDGGLIGIITPDVSGGYMLNANRSGNAQWYDYGPSSGGLGNLHATSPGPGYYCGVRTASNAEAFYFASSGSAHAALATGSTAPGEALVGINVYIFNCNGTSVPTTNKRISYTSISKGLTSTKSSHQYNRVQTLRTTLGGGFQ